MTTKVTQIFKDKDNPFVMALNVSEAKNVYWFDRFEIVPISYIVERYQHEYPDEEKDILNIIDWWNSQQIHVLLQKLREKYPNSKPQPQTLSVVVGELKKNGVEHAYADKDERAKFYSSLDWSYVKYLRFFIDKGKCQRCGIKPLIPEINHLYPIASEKFPALFIRNLDVSRVQTLCHECHVDFHKQHVNGNTHFVPKI